MSDWISGMEDDGMVIRGEGVAKLEVGDIE